MLQIRQIGMLVLILAQMPITVTEFQYFSANDNLTNLLQGQNSVYLTQFFFFFFFLPVYLAPK